MSDERKWWLQNLNAGDKVIAVCGRSFSRYREIRVVDKTTKTQIVVGTRRYRRENGCLCGDRYGGRIEEPSAETMREMDLERRNDKAKATIRELSEYHRWRDLPLASLEKLAAAMKAIIKSQPAERSEP